MGQKVHPIGMRLKLHRDRVNANWYVDRRFFSKFLKADIEARSYLEKKLANASVSRIKIERVAKNAKIIIYSGRPGMIIGKKGSDLDQLRDHLQNKIMHQPVHITVEEIKKPEADAKLVAENVAQQLVRRVMFRRAMKRAVSNALRSGALGVKIKVSGRLGGAEIARTEWYLEGRVPLHTFRADIDYALAEAHTVYGVIGVKVWIYKGDLLEDRGAATKPSLKNLDHSDRSA